MTEDSSDSDEQLLVEIARRAELFEALRETSHTARELESRLRMSRSTIHRATHSLEERGVIRKNGDGYELTGMGRVLAEGLFDIQTKTEAACRLKPFLNTIEASEVDIPVEEFAEARVTRPRPRQVHFGVSRIIDCIDETESLKIFSSILSPLYVDTALRNMHCGTEINAIFDADLVDIITERYAEEAFEALETGRFHVRVTEHIPFELFIFDDQMGMAAHDDNGVPRAFVETDSRGAIRWAENLFSRYAEAANSIDLLQSAPVVGDRL